MNDTDNKYGIKAPVQTTEDRFIYMLEVMPPSRWYRGNRIEFFHVCERLSGDVVMWFARVDKTYWEFQDLSTLTKAQIVEKLQAAVGA